MFKIKAKLRAPTLKRTEYVKMLEDTSRNLLSRAMLEYISTFRMIVPVWSGASHGTLSKLAELIGVPLVIAPSSTVWKGMVGKDYGRAHGDAYYDDKGGVFVFSFETDLPHLTYNEFTNANLSPDPGLVGRLITPGPYDFIGHTNNTVRTVLRQFVPPDLNQHIRSRGVRK